MLQRKQSVFYFLAALCLLLMPTQPLLEMNVIQSGTGTIAESVKQTLYVTQYNQYSPGSKEAETSLVAFAVGIYFCALTSLLVLFQYKNRGFQLRFTQTLILVCLTLQAAYGIMAWRTTQMLTQPATETHWHYTLILPIIATVFLVLARKGVKADEELVRSADRIR